MPLFVSMFFMQRTQGKVNFSHEQTRFFLRFYNANLTFSRVKRNLERLRFSLFTLSYKFFFLFVYSSVQFFLFFFSLFWLTRKHMYRLAKCTTYHSGLCVILILTFSLKFLQTTILTLEVLPDFSASRFCFLGAYQVTLFA